MSGTELTVFVATPGQENADGDALGDAYDPSPHDHSQIAFSSNRDGNFEIHGMKTDGTGRGQATRDPILPWS